MFSVKPANNKSSQPQRRRSLSLTIRAQLTLWSAGMIAAVYLILAGIVFWGLVGLVQAEVDTLIQGQSQELIARVHQNHDDLAEAEQEIRKELSRRLRKDFRFRVLDDAGQQILTTDPEQHFPPTASSLRLNSAGFATVSAGDRYPSVRVYRERIPAGTRGLWAEVTYSLDQMNSNLWHYGMLWLATVPLVVLLAGIGGSLLARRSLRPVSEMIAGAKRIEGDPSGKRIEVRGTGDELDQLAETLNNMLQRIEHHVQQITQFTADASHELRSPLAALRGAAEVALMRRSSVEELRTVLENAVEEYDRLTRITEDLLLLARLDSCQNPFRFERLRIGEVVKNAVDLYKAVAESRDTTLTLSNIAEGEISGDSGRLLQLFGNLIDNAVKNTPAGGRIELTVEHTADDVLIIVKDTGIGIPAQHLDHVFERFYRADDSRDRSSPSGAGLGLSICKAIAEAHGGTISLKSVENVGTDVHLRFPTISKMNELSSFR
jgi:heavy metal sensor kinase